MKLHAITIAIAMAAFAGAAAAGNQQTMSPVYVSPADVAACTPPSDAPACGNFHRWIRANFSEREIGMLFGARTSYPESLTGGIDRLQKRYQALVQEYVAQQNAASEQVAAK
ncbi:MAG: hypothetical protein JSS21_08010 [Proteobacteria bacterium]|nr:hypothetical protein [Pseudomonadota bacterium]